MKAVFFLTAVLLSGCSLLPKPAINISAASIDVPSTLMQELQQGNKPRLAIPVSVYTFRDQTGQYKPQANVSSFSTAVTQGATSILTQTLLDSGWFAPLEREGLQNLLTERKIHGSNKKAAELPPLKEARLLFEGGIISYETNLTTGGIGAEYFGVGASELYREDQVTIYLRAVDVHTGQVLLSVASNKKVFSQELRAGLFRYVSLNRLLEAEGGYSTNEPVQYCVKQAIETAVAELISQGQQRGFWRADTQAGLTSEG
ncbi:MULTISPECIES: CsgG/HfaB family protein [Rheinheimera]|jgi:curli production assembly/transport component CsgG|uniref:CsgG/HfaB family protein n=1 Tax=Rheinheimera TaxID=67575 RepID=UPI001BFECF68|nr:MULTISPECIES: CsgG/HfaB family protein [Rheinheimera]MCS4309057.1 curli production assembly/transport component CsgG [Rheinheimera pacifica]